MEISVALLEEAKRDDPSFSKMTIREEDGLERLLEKASVILGTEVEEAIESTHNAVITDTEEVMPGDKIFFKPVRVTHRADCAHEHFISKHGKLLYLRDILEHAKRDADIVLTIPNAKCFSIKDGKNTPLTSGNLELLLVPTEKNNEVPHLFLRVGESFLYSLNARADGTSHGSGAKLESDLKKADSKEGGEGDKENGDKKDDEGAVKIKNGEKNHDGKEATKAEGGEEAEERTEGEEKGLSLASHAMLPVVIHQRRHLVIPGKEDGSYFGIALPASTSEGLLTALKEILEGHALLNVGPESQTTKGEEDGEKGLTTQGENGGMMDVFKAQAYDFLVRAQRAGGEVKESELVQLVLKAGHQVGSRAVEFASDVSTEIKKSVNVLKDDIRKQKEQSEDSTYTSAVATVITKKAASVAGTDGSAGETAMTLSKDVREKVDELVEKSRDEEGSPRRKGGGGPNSRTHEERHINVSIWECMRVRSRRIQCLCVLLPLGMEELKLVDRLNKAQDLSKEGVRKLTTAVDGLLAAAKKKGGKSSKQLMTRQARAWRSGIKFRAGVGGGGIFRGLGALSEQLKMVERAQALGTWTSDSMTDAVVAVKKATNEVQKLVKDRHVHAALKEGMSTLQTALTETAVAIESAGRDKKTTGEKVEAYIDASKDMTVQGIKASTEMVAMGIRIGKSVLKSKIGHSTKGVKIPPRVKAAILKAQQFSAGAAVISEALVERPQAQASSQTSSSSSSSPRLKMLGKIQGPVGDAAKAAEKVIGKAAVSWTQVVLAMKDAGVQLTQELGDATSEIAEYGFGAEVGEVVAGGVEAYTNVTKAMTSVSQCTDYKGIAKKQAQKALKVASKAYNEEVGKNAVGDKKMIEGSGSGDGNQKATPSQADPEGGADK
eukprot:jgi/Bigna1/82128/fgenesh1_pg.88_\